MFTACSHVFSTSKLQMALALTRRKKLTLTDCLSLRGRWRVDNVLCVVLSGIVIYFLISSRSWSPSRASQPVLNMRSLNSTQMKHSHKTRCRFHTCFDISRCVFSTEDRIGVHVGEWCEFHTSQPPHTLSPKPSVEYAELVEAVKGSRYYMADPSSACIFIPPLDTLSQRHVEVATMSVLLNSLPE